MRRLALAVTVLIGLAGGALVLSRDGPGREGPSKSPAAARPASERLFAPDSIWNAAVVKDPELDPDSAARVRALSDAVAQEIGEHSLYPAIAAESYSTPIYEVPAGQPRVAVALPDVGAYGDSLRAALADGVPIPSNAKPAAGTDGHLTVYQPSSDTLWEFWRARMKDGTWQASWGGAMRHVSTNPGYYSDSVWPGLAREDGWHWGSTATSLPVAAGTITLQELSTDEIPHALAASIPDACADLVVRPARRGDGEDTRGDCMPEGAHLQLDPDLDLDALDLAPVTEMVARAAQKRGLVVRDVTRGGSVSLFAEAPQGRSPYGDATGPFGGLPPWKTLIGFPWHRLRMLAAEPCTTDPCSD